MRGPRAVPGEIRYTEITGADGKITLKKEKYYYWVLSFGNLTYNSYLKYITGYAGNEKSYQTHIDLYPDLTEQIYQFLPDRDCDFTIINSYFFKKPINSKWVIEPESINTLEDYLNEPNPYIQENDFQDFIDGLPIGTYFSWFLERAEISGYGVYDAWASYKEKEETEPESAPPNALDKDWTLEEVKKKQQEIQEWVDNNLYPPIFGPTNCVYFPSNLGNTKPEDFASARNPIIKSYPLSGGVIPINTYEYYGMNYPMTSNFIQIKGKKDDIITFNTYFPYFGINLCRFPVVQDDMSFAGDEGEIKPPDPFPGACDGIDRKLPDQYKVNQIVGLRFVEQDAAANGDLIKEQKFNKYRMSGIITSVVTPEDIPNQPATKGTITVKLLQDYGLTEDDYFNARVAIISNQSNNFIQNETYSIQRYYKKDLGVGPRLGGSLNMTQTNQTTRPVTETGSYMYIGVLKDEEKLNKPYLNISYQGSFSNGKNVFGTIENIDSFIHEFSEADLPGQFVTFGNQDFTDFKPVGGYTVPYSKKYFEGYYSYLIKNLDEHSYEYYVELRKTIGGGGVTSNTDMIAGFIPNFAESNENPDITFSSYS